MSARKRKTTFESLRRRAAAERREDRVTRAAVEMDAKIDALLADPKKNPLPIPDVVVPVVLSLAGMLAGDGEQGDAIRRCADLRSARWFFETAISQIDAAMKKKSTSTKNTKKERAT